MDDNIITQLSIFINNEPGRLAQTASVMKECGINMRAFSLAESTEFGIFRAIVQDPEAAFDKLRARGIIVKKTAVIGIAIQDTPGSLIESVEVLGGSGINIEYGYAYTGRTDSVFFIRVDDPAKAVDVLKGAGLRLVRDSEI